MTTKTLIAGPSSRLPSPAPMQAHSGGRRTNIFLLPTPRSYPMVAKRGRGIGSKRG